MLTVVSWLMSAVFSQVDVRALAISLGVIGLGLGGFVAGHHQAASACRARELAGQLADARETIARSDRARADADARAVDLETLAASLQQKVRDHAADRPPLATGDVCRLSGGDVDRLRALRR